MPHAGGSRAEGVDDGDVHLGSYLRAEGNVILRTAKVDAGRMRVADGQLVSINLLDAADFFASEANLTPLFCGLSDFFHNFAVD